MNIGDTLIEYFDHVKYRIIDNYLYKLDNNDSLSHTGYRPEIDPSTDFRIF